MLGRDDKPIQITGLDTIHIDVSAFPEYMIRNLNRSFIDRAEEYFRDPAHVAECNAWLAEYEARRARQKKKEA